MLIPGMGKRKKAKGKRRFYKIPLSMLVEDIGVYNFANKIHATT